MLTQTRKPPNAALIKRVQALIFSLERARERLERQTPQGGFSTTLSAPIREYREVAERLGRRLEGNPRTLRRRLGALKRELARRKRIQETLRGLEDWGEQRRQEAALRADVVGRLVGLLEVTIRPGLARQMAHPPPKSAQPLPTRYALSIRNDARASTEELCAEAQPYEVPEWDGRAEEHAWHSAAAFPMAAILLVGREPWSVWYARERARRPGYAAALEAGWLTAPEQGPIIGVMVDELRSLWDGAQRVGMAASAGLTTIPAIVGVKNGEPR